MLRASVPITGVERRLSAAGDFLRADHRVPEPFQDFDHADADARVNRVHKARDEKRDGHVRRTGGQLTATFFHVAGHGVIKKIGIRQVCRKLLYFENEHGGMKKAARFFTSPREGF